MEDRCLFLGFYTSLSSHWQPCSIADAKWVVSLEPGHIPASQDRTPHLAVLCHDPSSALTSVAGQAKLRHCTGGGKVGERPCGWNWGAADWAGCSSDRVRPDLLGVFASSVPREDGCNPTLFGGQLKEFWGDWENSFCHWVVYFNGKQNKLVTQTLDVLEP